MGSGVRLLAPKILGKTRLTPQRGCGRSGFDRGYEELGGPRFDRGHHFQQKPWLVLLSIEDSLPYEAGQ
jgi:hypothetical protein